MNLFFDLGGAGTPELCLRKSDPWVTKPLKTRNTHFGFFRVWSGWLSAVGVCGGGFLRHSRRCSKCPREEVSSGAGAVTQLWPGYPLSGCSSAEPDSVSPGTISVNVWSANIVRLQLG